MSRSSPEDDELLPAADGSLGDRVSQVARFLRSLEDGPRAPRLLVVGPADVLTGELANCFDFEGGWCLVVHRDRFLRVDRSNYTVLDLDEIPYTDPGRTRSPDEVYLLEWSCADNPIFTGPWRVDLFRQPLPPEVAFPVPDPLF